MLFIAADQLGGDVLGVGGAAAIAADQNLMTRIQSLANKLSRLFNLCQLRVQQCLKRLQMLS